MKKIQLLHLSLIVLVVSAFKLTTIQEWEITAGYRISFNGKFADGTFDKLSGTILFNPTDPAKSSFDVTIDVASIDTGKDLKNKHAVSDKWLNAERFPVIHFVSSEVSRTDTSYNVKGEFELRGVKKEISIPFTFEEENGKGQFHGRFKVNRGEFGIGKSTGKDSDYTSVEILVPVLAK
jgi:polyisoprenoid-binding protein YceI